MLFRSLVLEITEKRYRQAIDRAVSLGCPKLVLQEEICQIPDDMCLVCVNGMPAMLDEKFCGYLK